MFFVNVVNNVVDNVVVYDFVLDVVIGSVADVLFYFVDDVAEMLL